MTEPAAELGEELAGAPRGQLSPNSRAPPPGVAGTKSRVQTGPMVPASLPSPSLPRLGGTYAEAGETGAADGPALGCGDHENSYTQALPT